MYPCKSRCLVETCDFCPVYFANYSRFHRICSQHFENNNPCQTLKCRECANDIKIVKNSELSLPQRSNPCLQEECSLTTRDFLCSNHRFCDNHLTNIEFIYCNYCMCSVCYKLGAYNKAKYNTYCSNCYYISFICFYCQSPAIDKFEECEHFYCLGHNYPLYYCKCKLCKNCGKEFVKKKSCKHDFECNCDYKELCIECINAYYPS
jgi:hypothetical protein